MHLKTLRNIFLILVIVVLSFGTGYRLGSGSLSRELVAPVSLITGKTPTRESSVVDFSLFWDVWERLRRYYIDKEALIPQKMVYGAISGMVNSLSDPYTVFLTPEQNKEAKEDLGGRFEGIGAQLGVKDKKIVVIAPLKDAPAEKAGLLSGDWIVKVDGEETINWSLPEAVSKIRGPKGSKVVLTILSKGATVPAEITVVRDTIKVASIEWEIKTGKWAVGSGRWEIKDDCQDCDKIVYLKLSRFGDTTNDEWNKAVEQIKSKIQNPNDQIKGLIFDLRNNPGGYLSGSVFIASEFLKEGPVVVQQQASGEKQTYTVNRKGGLIDIPMVVLINKGTASASEIVAGALQVAGRAKIVGESSFGKGSVQEAQELAEGAGIHITTAKWLLPNGKWINDKGIDPDVKIENDISKPDEDLQLLKGIEVLLK